MIPAVILDSGTIIKQVRHPTDPDDVGPISSAAEGGTTLTDQSFKKVTVNGERMRTRSPDPSELRECLRDPLETALQPYGGLGKMSILHAPTEGIGDNPIRILILNAKSKPAAVLSCSQPVAPDYIAQENEKARCIKDGLGNKLGRVILEPLASGEVDGLTYTVMPYRYPLSNTRVTRRIQRAVLGARLLRWLRRVTKSTITVPRGNDIEQRFVKPLNHIVGHTDFGNGIRRRAERAMTRLLSGQWQPKHVLDHNDLWLGNVLLDSSCPGWGRLTKGFVIIDWRGANPHGYGIFDLLQLAQSIGLSHSRLARELQVHRRILDCSSADSMSQLLTGLGCLGMHLECFPGERYVELVQRCCRTLFAVVGE